MTPPTPPTTGSEPAANGVHARARSRWWWLLAALGAAVVVVAIVAVVTVSGGSAPGFSDAADVEAFEYDYVIPAGTQARLDAGETVEIVPASLTVRVGESIRIVNDDDANHVVGGFFVPAGATLQQHFNSAGELIGECDVHPSGTFRLIVEP